jgi:hypothetical protein
VTDQPNLPRGFRGEARIDRPLLELGPVPPWHATVKVVPVELQRAVVFDVVAEWTGPPALYMPADDRPGLRQDIYNAGGNPELAKAVAMAALDELRAVQVPDLRALAERFTEPK